MIAKLLVAFCLAASATAQATPADASARLDIQFGVTGDNVCDLALDHTAEVRAIVAKNIKVAGEAMTDADIVFYDVAGCNARRRRKVLGATATITVGFATAGPVAKGVNADGFYDAATESLKEAITVISADFAAACGASVNVDTIKVELSTLLDEAPEERDLKFTHDANKVTYNAFKNDRKPHDNSYAEQLPNDAATYYAGGDCPNSCSGHGACSTNGCVCWPNWGNGDGTGGACDQRVCPYAVAWADVPSGPNEAHALRECAGKGVCDRTTGDCQCFPGFEGKGCKRSSCPHACSGHGRCEPMSHMRNDVGDAFKFTGNRPTVDQYATDFPLLWDAQKTMGCVCDPKWRGADCSIRMCPRGDYPQYFALTAEPEVQAVVIKNIFTPGTDCGGRDLNGHSLEHRNNMHPNTDAYHDLCKVNQKKTNDQFALTFRSPLGEEFTTPTLHAYNVTEAIVEAALNGLPNKVVQDATVVMYRNSSLLPEGKMDYSHKLRTHWRKGRAAALTDRINNDPRPLHHGKDYRNDPTKVHPGQTVAGAEYWYSNDLVLLITFQGAMNSGDVFALECKTAYCGAGCQPRLEFPIDAMGGSSCTVHNDFQPAIAVNWECSGRGDCDQAGVCQCYQGYTDEYCSTRTAII